MAEEFEKFKRFEYRMNSNLVLQREGGGLGLNEPTGEPESLVGRILYKMGDKVSYKNAIESYKNKLKNIKKKEKPSGEEAKEGAEDGFEEEGRKSKVLKRKNKLGIVKGSTVLDASVSENYTYRPSTAQTKEIYENLLNVFQSILGEQPNDVLKGAVDETLTIIKSDNIKENERRNHVEDILSKLDDAVYTKIYRLCKQITDFKFDEEDEDDMQMNHNFDDTDGLGEVSSHRIDRGDTLDDSSGVAVIFDQDDEEEEEIGDVEEDDRNDEDDEDEQSKKYSKFFMEERDQQYLSSKHNEDDEEEYERDKYELDISKIDSHWLQRELNNIFADPNLSVATEKEILSIINTKDIQQCENKLVFILKYDNFEFAKKILKNRWKILYCTRLGQAQTPEEKMSIVEEMKNSEEGQAVLDLLQTVNSRKDKEKEITRSVRKEAQCLALKAQELERGEKYKDAVDEYNSLGKARSINIAGSDEVEGSGNLGENSSGGILNEKNSAHASSDKSNEKEEKKKPMQFIDFDSLAFLQGGHLMTNEKVTLPEGSQRIDKKSYDEVTVYPYKKPTERSEERKSISELPEWTHPAFLSANVDKLNLIQTKVCDIAFNHYDENMLVCAPTGAGKTNIAMLAMLNVIGKYRTEAGVIDLNSFKIVYISPMKALVAEQVQSFSFRLSSYGIVVKELTGDVSQSKSEIEQTQVIITTPEKWDIITRKAGERTYTQLVRLIIIDEVHLLHDNRGPVLEGIVARTIRHIEVAQEPIRLVGLSATLPNYEDVALFMRVKADKGLFVFGNHYRPVPLLQTYIGIKERKSIKRYNTINQVTYEKVMENAGVNQVLIFVHSRKETIKTATMLRDLAMQNDALNKFLQDCSASREILLAESEAIKTIELKDLLPYGFAVHHAGLPRTDRKLIEDLFADRHIQVLVSTATLAWGVNLPAHTVIVKGTQIYVPEKGSWCEISPMDIMQMIGRGGRPQYDVTGHAIVITNHSELQYHLSLNNQQLPIESQMISMLPDILNAEIVLGTVRSREDAVNWLGYTYLYVRMLRNPHLYGISDEEREKDRLLIQRRVDIAHSAFLLLDRSDLIRYDKRTGLCQLTALGRVASHYYIKHHTIAIFNEHLKPTMSDIEIFRLFALSHEFKYIPVREEEKVELQKLMERVPIPIKGSSEETSSKVNVLLQAYISKLKLEGFALMTDMVYVQQSACRIMRAIFEIALRRGWASLAHKTLDFCKMIDKRMWGSMSPLRQFKVLPEELIRKMEKKGFSWERYYDLSSSELGELIRMPKMGKTLHRLVHTFPKLDLVVYVQPLTRTCLNVEVTITPDFQWDSKIHGNAELFWIFIEDVNGENIVHHEVFILNSFKEGYESLITCIVPIYEPLPPNYFIRVLSDRWLHSESVMPISFKSLILPEKNPPHTELLDLQLLPVTALRFPKAEALYSTYVKSFNPIQTQVFSTLYNTNENVLICSPPASGKIICAEFALLRMIKTESTQRAVYIAPYEDTAKQRFSEWSVRFGKILNLTVSELTGELQTDLKIIEKSNLIITTPDKWDFVSRRWKNRKVLQNIRLFIVDELQLLDSRVGPALEVCVSRMRYISAQLNNFIRIIGLSCSLANAKDVAEWIGASSNGLFNFHPNVRTVPLEISIHGFDLYHRQSRLLAMSKPVYQSIKHYSSDKPVIIFTSDRKQCRLTAIDLLLQAAADDTPKRFLHISDELMSQHIRGAREKSLEDALKYGVGYYHEGFTQSERLLVERLFENGAIQVLITTEKLAWSMTNSSHLVVIMDTKKFTNEGFVDYCIHDLLQMISRATRPYVDKNGVVVLLCHSAKKEYYKKFLFEPVPVESRLDTNFCDHLNAEIVLKTIENKQDAVDWLTWTFYYRRLSKNPNYYGLQGISHQHLSDHLSELVETSVDALEKARCISVEDDVDLQPLNIGLIAAFYYIQFTTVELYNGAITSNMKRKGILELICASSEFDNLSMRVGEGGILKVLAKTFNLKLSEQTEVNDPHFKTLILLYAHLNRTGLSADLAADQKIVLESVSRLIHALVDVISSNGFLQPALLTIEVSQMIIQALNTTQAPLRQLPHFNNTLIQKSKQMDVEDVFDLINMKEEDRDSLLSCLTESQLMDVAKACNRYPVINLNFFIQNENDIRVGDNIKCVVEFERDMPEDSLGAVYAPYYPKEKDEQWWLIIAQSSTNNLCAIKKINVNKPTFSVTLDFEAPEKPASKYNYSLYLMSDCYIGCDQEYKFDIHLK